MQKKKCEALAESDTLHALVLFLTINCVSFTGDKTETALFFHNYIVSLFFVVVDRQDSRFLLSSLNALRLIRELLRALVSIRRRLKGSVFLTKIDIPY